MSKITAESDLTSGLNFNSGIHQTNIKLYFVVHVPKTKIKIPKRQRSHCQAAMDTIRDEFRQLLNGRRPLGEKDADERVGRVLVEMLNTDSRLSVIEAGGFVTHPPGNHTDMVGLYNSCNGFWRDMDEILQNTSRCATR